MPSQTSLLERLEKHKQNLALHFEKASRFLVKCQIIAPYVEKGTLYGAVCPWEIGESAGEGAFPILEDFHDSLEAIWVWTYYAKVSEKQTFVQNLDWAWAYIVENWNRFIGGEAGKGLYDCSYVLFSGILYEEVFRHRKYRELVLKAGTRLAKYLNNLKSTEGREYSDPFWMVCCLSLAAKSLKQEEWLSTAERFVKRTIVTRERPFSKAENEPRHIGPGSHDFFSKNANKALALISCLDRQNIVGQMISEKFLPCIPKRFVSRHADENAWNAHLATAIGKSYQLTSNKEFLNSYFAIMNKLEKRDVQHSAALSRSPQFPRRESWVTFFCANAYASLV